MTGGSEVAARGAKGREGTARLVRRTSTGSVLFHDMAGQCFTCRVRDTRGNRRTLGESAAVLFPVQDVNARGRTH